jgi:hypothetical protein
MDDGLRMDLWNVTYARYFHDGDVFHYRGGHRLIQVIWAGHLRRNLADVPDNAWSAGEALRPLFQTSTWFDVYNLVQEIVDANPETQLISQYNSMLERNIAGYRIVDNLLTPLTDTEEITEIEAALNDTSQFAAARHHLSNALAFFSDREKPDYPNSVKESVSAVEAVAVALTGKKELGPALEQLKRDGWDLHGALVSGWKSLYGFASDEDGIRHGGVTVPDVSPEFARYFLVTSSAFVNLLLGLKSRT